jgi:hypothetical protein
MAATGAGRVPHLRDAVAGGTLGSLGARHRARTTLAGQTDYQELET